MKKQIKDLENDIMEMAQLEHQERNASKDIISRRMVEMVGAIRCTTQEIGGLYNSEKEAIRTIEFEVQEAMADICRYLRAMGDVPNLKSAIGKCITGISNLSGEDRIQHDKSKVEVRQRVWDLTGGKCAYCGVDLIDGGVQRNSFVVEHIVPKSADGPDRFENYVPSCSACNLHKRDGHVLSMDDNRSPSDALRLVKSAQEKSA